MSGQITTADGAKTIQSSRRQNWLRAFYRFRQSHLSIVGLAVVALLAVTAIAGPWIVPFPQQALGAVDTASRFQSPSPAHLFGTNELGQDMFTLVLSGARISLFAGAAIVVLAASFGTLVGAIAGYFRGWVDEVLMRVVDLMLTLPSLILALAVAASLGSSLGHTVFAIALSWWPGFARLVRGEVIAKKEEAFVQAARALGATSARILLRHILPNVMSPVIVKVSLDIGFAILSVASLGFIGIGVKPPTPEWGTLLSVARGNMPDYWWTAVFPGLAIFLAVFGFSLLGDGLRDVLDPKARR
ncbi:ABC transporter permease [Trinickia sp.]|uniref:ABC transporter permease n=1 Tax=Trinickia sp. TaxID=2571163 RepID=UPI003F7F4758